VDDLKERKSIIRASQREEQERAWMPLWTLEKTLIFSNYYSKNINWTTFSPVKCIHFLPFQYMLPEINTNRMKLYSCAQNYAVFRTLCLFIFYGREEGNMHCTLSMFSIQRKTWWWWDTMYQLKNIPIRVASCWIKE